MDALKAGEITLGAAKAFTVADDEALALSVLEQVRGREMSEHRLKQLLQPQAINAAGDRRARFVGIDVYRAASGRMTADLFADTALLQDGELLARLFAEKLTAEAAAAAQGWKWAETVEAPWIDYQTTAPLVAGAIPVLPAAIVTQTLVELIAELFYIRVLPGLGRADDETGVRTV